MYHNGSSLQLPKETTRIFVVDPLRDFLEESGVFAQCYGLEDTKPIRAIRSVLEDIVGQRQCILCASHYKHDQFDVQGLEKLCTTARGREPVIPKGNFVDAFEKTTNSILSDRENVDRILSGATHAVITGVTTTHCIAMSVEDFHEQYRELICIIPRDAVASRTSRKNDEQALFKRWQKEGEEIIVVDSVQDIDLC